MPLSILTSLVVSNLAVAAYDPMKLPPAAAPEPLELVVHDAGRDRNLPLRVYLPVSTNPAPVILFSHGLGGNRQGSAFLGRHWSARGYVVVFLQHPGSDDGVWKDKPLAQRIRAMHAAASAQNFQLRVKDIPIALDQLTDWSSGLGHPLRGRVDPNRVGMSGHSFGAITTQAVSGQAMPGGDQPYTDARIKAAIVFSPSAPQRGSAETAFGRVKIPWLLMTGTHDVARIGGETIGAADVAARLAVFPALPPGAKYELVLHEGRHFAFTDRPDFGREAPRNPNHHRAILALSTAFWDAHLQGDADARAWIEGNGPRTVLEESDRWQVK